MIELHYWPTPNGHKVALFLEEAGLDYRIHPVDIGRGAQFEPDFLAISPNNRMPAIVDRARGRRPRRSASSNPGRSCCTFRKNRPVSARRRARLSMHWVAVLEEMGGLGRWTGHTATSMSIARSRSPMPSSATTRESRACSACLTGGLPAVPSWPATTTESPTWPPYPWLNPYDRAPLDLEPFAEVRRWQSVIAARPATQRAYALAAQVNPDAGKPMGDEQKALLFGQGAKRD